MKRPSPDLDWPRWPSRGPWFDWPDTWPFSQDAGISVEEFEEDGQMVVRAEMPGLDPDKDVEVTTSDNSLNIRAERREESRTEEKKGYRSEFRYGLMTRTIPLPPGAASEDIKADYHDGILEVRVPINPQKQVGRRSRSAGPDHRSGSRSGGPQRSPPDLCGTTESTTTRRPAPPAPRRIANLRGPRRRTNGARADSRVVIAAVRARSGRSL
jgi:HSP20 family protein